MTKTAKELDRDLIEHACEQLSKTAKRHLGAGMGPATAAWEAIRETKALFPADWNLAVQGDDDDEHVEVWEVDDKRTTVCAHVAKQSVDEIQKDLVTAVKQRARESSDPVVRAIAKWSNAKLFDILESAMPETEGEAFRAAVEAATRRSRLKKTKGHATVKSETPDAFIARVAWREGRYDPSHLRVGQRLDNFGETFEILKIGRDKNRTVQVARRVRDPFGKETLIDHRSFPARDFNRQNLRPVD